jgi:hypothetical protein
MLGVHGGALARGRPPLILPPRGLWRPPPLRRALIDGQFKPAQRLHLHANPDEVPFVGAQDSFTKLLLHCDGADGSTSFTDFSTFGHTVTASLGAQVDTAQSKFGDGSALFDGVDSRLSVPDNSNLEIGSQDFTIDLWVRINALPADGELDPIFCKGQIWNSNCSFAGSYYRSGSAYSLSWRSSVSGAGFDGVQEGRTWSPSPTTGTWYHLAWTRSGSTGRMFVNGTQLGANITDGNTFDNNSGAVWVGHRQDSPTAFDGWMDEIRYSIGVARWTANFTPPTGPY